MFSAVKGVPINTVQVMLQALQSTANSIGFMLTTYGDSQPGGVHDQAWAHTARKTRRRHALWHKSSSSPLVPLCPERPVSGLAAEQGGSAELQQRIRRRRPRVRPGRDGRGVATGPQPAPRLERGLERRGLPGRCGAAVLAHHRGHLPRRVQARARESNIECLARSEVPD